MPASGLAPVNPALCLVLHELPAVLLHEHGLLVLLIGHLRGLLLMKLDLLLHVRRRVVYDLLVRWGSHVLLVLLLRRRLVHGLCAHHHHGLGHLLPHEPKLALE